MLRGQNAVGEAINHLRRKLITTMSSAGFEADSDSVVLTGKSGYQLNPALRVSMEHSSEEPRKPDDKDLSGEERQNWILEQLATKKKSKRVAIEEQFRKSTATVKRDLGALDDRIEFVGTGRNGYYVLRKAAANSGWLKSS